MSFAVAALSWTGLMKSGTTMRQDVVLARGGRSRDETRLQMAGFVSELQPESGCKL
jgi:hypothetical protein